MPVYRNGKAKLHGEWRAIGNFVLGRLGKKRPTSQIIRANTRIIRENGKRKFKLGKKWTYHASPLRVVDKDFALPPEYKLETLIKRVIGENPTSSTNVLEWGCAAGTATAQLGRKFEGDKRAHFFGYSQDAYFDWHENSKHATFIQAPTEDLVKYVKRIKPRIIFSHFGFFHMTPEEIKTHIKSIAPHLPPKCIVVANCNILFGGSSPMREAFIQNGFKMIEQRAATFVFVKE